MNNLSKGMLIGGLVGISSIALLNLDRNDIRRVQRKSKNIMTKANNLMHDIKGYI
jgi:hypothetical protein